MANDLVGLDTISRHVMGGYKCDLWVTIRFKGHAIKTNHPFIKPLVAGTYMALAAGKIAAPFFAAVYTLPYSSEKLPMAWTAALIAGSSLAAFAVAQMVSVRTKLFLGKALNDYGTLIGMEWTEDLLQKLWQDTREFRENHIFEKKKTLSHQEREQFDVECKRLTQILENALEDCNFRFIGYWRNRVHIGELAGWQASKKSESAGMWALGIGSLMVTVGSVILRRQLQRRAILQRYSH